MTLGKDGSVELSGGNRPSFSLITILLFWCALIVVSSVYVTTPLASGFVAEFHITKTMAAWTTSIFSFFYACGFIIFSPLSDRYGRKRVILSGLYILTLVTFLIGLTDQFYWLVILRGIQGLVAATFAPTAVAYVFDIFPKNRQVTTIGFISFGFLTAGIFGQVFAGAIDQFFGWNMVFLCFGGMYLCTIIAVTLFLPKTGKHTSKINIHYFLRQTKRIFIQKNFLLCYIITLVLLLTFIGMYTALGDLMSQNLNLTKQDGLFVRTSGLLGMLLSLFAGVLVKKYGLLPILKMGLGTAVGALFSLGFSSNITFVVSMSVFFVAGISVTFPAIMTLIGELGGDNRAIAASYYACILFIGATIGPIITITLMQAGSYVLTFGVLAFLLAIGYTAAFFIKHE
ncbi:MFS transporter [Virgibacillus sp. DJP39]|uniref:MFS transporter n=1 Tax=Virgibacillus sp. DJP39 TaxID=3409790 RepID=UPI003BB55AF0